MSYSPIWTPAPGMKVQSSHKSAAVAAHVSAPTPSYIDQTARKEIADLTARVITLEATVKKMQAQIVLLQNKAFG